MTPIFDILRTHSPGIYLVLGLLALSLLVGLGLSVLVMLGRRPPAPLWWIAPLLALTVASGLGGLAAAQASGAIVAATPSAIESLSFVAMWEARGADVVALYGVALCGLTMAWGAALAVVIKPGEGAQRTLAPALITAVLIVLCAAGIGAWMVTERLGGILIPVTLLVGGLACALSGLRMGADGPDAERVASVRALIWFCVVVAVVSVTVASAWQAFYESAGALSRATPDTRLELLSLAVKADWFYRVSGAASAAIAAIIAGVPMMYAAQHLFKGQRALIGAGILLVLLSLPATAMTLEHLQLSRLDESANASEHLEAIALRVGVPRPETLRGRRGGTSDLHAAPCVATYKKKPWKVAQSPLPGCSLKVGEHKAAFGGDERPLIVAKVGTKARIFLRRPFFEKAGVLDVLVYDPESLKSDDALPWLLRRHRFGLVPIHVREGSSTPIGTISSGPKGLVLDRGGKKRQLGLGEEVAERLKKRLKDVEADNAAIALRPDKKWTLQDLVSLCLTVRRESEVRECVLVGP